MTAGVVMRIQYVEEFPSSGSGDLVFKSGKKLNAGLVVS